MGRVNRMKDGESIITSYGYIAVDGYECNLTPIGAVSVILLKERMLLKML